MIREIEAEYAPLRTGEIAEINTSLFGEILAVAAPIEGAVVSYLSQGRDPDGVDLGGVEGIDGETEKVVWAGDFDNSPIRFRDHAAIERGSGRPVGRLSDVLETDLLELRYRGGRS